MLEDMLMTHFSLYPHMQPQDAVKLIYQQEFGPEHLIRDGAKAFSMLKNEMEGLGKPLPGESLYEPIGNGLCRLNLRPCLEKGIPPEDICALFIASAQAVTGDKKRFLAGIRALQRLAEEEETPFEPVALDLFLARYPKNLPPVHHSDEYRQAYAPAYRVVQQKRLKDYLAARRGEK